MLLGIDIDAYTYRGQDVAAAAAADVAYIRRLHANAVMISFPVFAVAPSTVRATSATPSPGALAIIIRAAQRARLYVSVRPLLDEASLGKSRVNWSPPHLQAWFASYLDFLLPYVAVAQRLRVPQFIVGSELSRLATAPRWNALDQAIRHRYHGQLAFAVNWDQALRGIGGGGQGVLHTVDAYPPVTGNLTAGWMAFDRALQRGAIETEVGIDAVTGAYAKPAQHHWNVTSLNEAVQAKWFTAACRAAAATHLGGIYFWSIGLTTMLGNGPTLTNQGAWAGGLGGKAVSACFVTLARSMRGRRH